MNKNELRQIVEYMGELQAKINEAPLGELTENQTYAVNEAVSTLNQTGIFLYDYNEYFEVKLKHLLEQKLSPIINDEDLEEFENTIQNDFDAECDNAEDGFDDDYINGKIFIRRLEDEASPAGANYELMCYSFKYGPVKLFDFEGPENVSSEGFKDFKINLLECGALKSNAVNPSILKAEEAFRGVQDFLWNAIEREQMDYLYNLKTNLAYSFISKRGEDEISFLEERIRLQEQFLGLEPESFEDIYNKCNPDQIRMNISDGIIWPQNNDDEQKC